MNSRHAKKGISVETTENNNNGELYNPRFDKIGYIQVYTGNGKGKTTASLGLTMRALGRGWKVLIIMFAKGGDHYGELLSFRELSPEIKKLLTIEQAGMDRVVYAANVTDEDRKVVAGGWKLAQEAAKSGEYDLIILDEANVAISLGLIPLEEMKAFLKNKPKYLEIVLTGRHAHDEVVELAHLVSEIQPRKHYWDIGVTARQGIEY